MVSRAGRLFGPISIGGWRLRARRRHKSGPRALKSGPLELLEGRFLLTTAHAPGRGHIAAPLVADHAAVLKNIVYENVAGRQEALDLYLPPGTPPAGGWPVLMAIHGGGWRRYNKDEYGSKVAEMFVPDGIAVVAMNYMLSAPGAPSWPANFEDVRNAVRWARTSAAEFGLDPNHFAAIGESAGGHLAALLGTNPDGPISTGGDPAAGDSYGAVSARVQAVIDFYGPTNLAALEEQSTEASRAVVQFLGGKPAQLPQSYGDASPVDHVTSATPPTLILQGSADTLIPPDQPEALARALSNAGVLNRLITVAGAPHGFEFQPSGRKLLPVILDFLRVVWQG
jgi:acetyl esterase/lipase